MATQETSAKNPTTERETAIRLLLFPQISIIPTRCDETHELKRIIRENPERLESLGLSRVKVFSPTCSDPTRGTWEVSAFHIWIDKETGTPIDSLTVKILDHLPDAIHSMPPRDLLNFLNPTYCRNSRDAQTVADLCNAAGPSSHWVSSDSL